MLHCETLSQKSLRSNFTTSFVGSFSISMHICVCCVCVGVHMCVGVPVGVHTGRTKVDVGNIYGLFPGLLAISIH